jgi:hypothetical protein
VANTASYKVAVTTTKTAISGFDPITIYNKIGVSNNVDADVEIYFGDSLVPYLIVPPKTDLAFDGFTFKGQAYIRSTVGTGDVYLYVWRYDSAGG